MSIPNGAALRKRIAATAKPGARPRKQPAVSKPEPASPLLPIEEIDYGFMLGLAGFWLRRAQLATLKSFSDHLGTLKLRPVEAAALILIGNNRGLSQSSLTAALATDQSSMVGISTRLEERGLIKRRRQVEDRRYQILDLTRQGEVAVGLLKDDLTSHNENVLRNLTATESEVLIRLLKKIVA